MGKSIKILNARLWMVIDTIKKASRIRRKQERQKKSPTKKPKQNLRKTPIEYLTAVHARLVKKLSPNSKDECSSACIIPKLSLLY